MNGFVKILLYPISFLYGLITWFRNKLYDWGVLKSHEFDIPIINVGNLSVGGTGKTPHVEYLIQLLKDNFNVATLSRGYKRYTNGFVEADSSTTFVEIGDEPMQYYFKFKKDIVVAVDENRVRGINTLMQKHTDLDIILLDDAYQHRQVKPGINILITDANSLYINDYPLPSGRLREFSRCAQRADIIIVSKNPSVLSPIDKRRIIEELNPLPHQDVFFSFMKYGNLKPFNAAAKQLNYVPGETTVILVTGIAKPLPLLYHLKRSFKDVKHLEYPDHHIFSETDITEIISIFNNYYGNNKIIISTEKDIMRLSLPDIQSKFENIPFFYQPIMVEFHGNDGKEFNEEILKYVTANSRNSVLLKNKNQHNP